MSPTTIVTLYICGEGFAWILPLAASSRPLLIHAIPCSFLYQLHTQWCRFLSQEVREISRFFVAPWRVFAPAVCALHYRPFHSWWLRYIFQESEQTEQGFFYSYNAWIVGKRLGTAQNPSSMSNFVVNRLNFHGNPHLIATGSTWLIPNRYVGE